MNAWQLHCDQCELVMNGIRKPIWLEIRSGVRAVQQGNNSTVTLTHRT